MAREPKVEDDGTCYLSFRVKVEPSLLYDVERLRVVHREGAGDVGVKDSAPDEVCADRYQRTEGVLR